jgi:beta-glucanase (GH16 family)
MTPQTGRVHACLTAVLGGSALLGVLGACDARGGVALNSWNLVWQDEFEGERLDRANWTVEVMPDPYNEELQYYPDRADHTPGANVWIENGVLVIEARREDFAHRHYTSARINTKGKREFLYGRFEARMRLPAEVGMWPAFWMLGGNIDAVGWPACGEIDIMEGKGRLPNWTSGALHRGPDAGSNLITAGQYQLPTGDLHQDWHVFAVEWQPEQIRWYVDDVLFQTVDKPAQVEPAYWPFDQHRFFLILNLAVGGWFDSPHLPPEDMQPQRLLVDYVRVYRPAASSGH